MGYWLVKSEPGEFSIRDLKQDSVTAWDGVRNYQARNYLRDMKKGDQVLFYHSVTKPVGVAGVAKVSKEAYPDATQFNKRSKYFDAKATKENPRWFSPDLKFEREFKEVVELQDLRDKPALKDMVLLQKGSRLSVQPVTKSQFDQILKLAK